MKRPIRFSADPSTNNVLWQREPKPCHRQFDTQVYVPGLFCATKGR